MRCCAERGRTACADHGAVTARGMAIAGLCAAGLCAAAPARRRGVFDFVGTLRQRPGPVAGCGCALGAIAGLVAGCRRGQGGVGPRRRGPVRHQPAGIHRSVSRRFRCRRVAAALEGFQRPQDADPCRAQAGWTFDSGIGVHALLDDRSLDIQYTRQALAGQARQATVRFDGTGYGAEISFYRQPRQRRGSLHRLRLRSQHVARARRAGGNGYHRAFRGCRRWWPRW